MAFRQVPWSWQFADDVRDSESDVLQHVFEATLIVIDLLLHLALVFLQVSQACLKMGIFLLLVRNRLVVCFADELKTWNDMRHIVLVYGFENMPHLFNLAFIELGLLSVLLQLLVGIAELLLHKHKKLMNHLRKMETYLKLFDVIFD